MELKLSDYKYHLPEDRIAKYPLENRSDSRLLVYNKGITHSKFYELEKYLPEKSTLVFNNTKVIPARIYFEKDTGSQIEVFLTEPILPSSDFQKAALAESPVTWKCIVGNKKKWKEDQTIYASLNNLRIQASWQDRNNDLVRLEWEDGSSFQQIIEAIGNMPLPPYMKRKAEENDKERYQTVYSRKKGAVAAPTAGLHFTEELINDISRSHELVEITLHVSAGTFRPISTDNIKEHDMHNEFVQIRREAIESLLQSDFLVLTGTTTLRTLESLYWFGVKLINGNTDFSIGKLYPYEYKGELPSRKDALQTILDFMRDNNLDEITGTTEIFIFPGYQFRMTDALITNFHLPGSTLILLVAAITGSDWKKIYQEAMDNDYRFLSYGDSSILFV